MIREVLQAIENMFPVPVLVLYDDKVLAISFSESRFSLSVGICRLNIASSAASKYRPAIKAGPGWIGLRLHLTSGWNSNLYTAQEAVLYRTEAVRLPSHIFCISECEGLRELSEIVHGLNKRHVNDCREADGRACPDFKNW